MRKGIDLNSAFTLLEILVALAIVGALIGAFLITVNPASLLSNARNKQREAHLNVIVNAIGQNIADNDGSFKCFEGALPTSTKRIAHPSSTPSSTYNIAPCLVPDYLAELHYDPRSPGNVSSTHYTSSTNYNSGYDIIMNTTTGRITLTAPYAELEETISITR